MAQLATYGLITLGIIIVITILIIVWLIFPFVVINRLNRIVKVIEKK